MNRKVKSFFFILHPTEAKDIPMYVHVPHLLKNDSRINIQIHTAREFGGSIQDVRHKRRT